MLPQQQEQEERCTEEEAEGWLAGQEVEEQEAERP